MPRPERLRLVFIVTVLHVGGAEMMLWKLLSRIDRTRFDPVVIALSGTTDHILQMFDDIAVPCHVLGMRAGTVSVGSLLRLRNMLRKLRPDLVQGWMYHGNIAATAAALGSSVPVLWNVRGSLDTSRTKWRTSAVIWLGGKLSRFAVRIVNNSYVSAAQHEKCFGYQAASRVIIVNGFDTDTFRPRREAGKALRETLGLPDDAVIVGMIGNYRSMKDHPNFLSAAAALRARYANVFFVLAGDRVDSDNEPLAELVARHALGDRVSLLGKRNDMSLIMAGLDICTLSSSSGEGFPNVIGEAMSAGVPCVVTDSGDAAAVVSDTGIVVPPRDPEALAAGVARLIDAGAAQRMALGARARQRVIEHFSLESVVREYEMLYAQVYDECTTRRGA